MYHKNSSDEKRNSSNAISENEKTQKYKRLGPNKIRRFKIFLGSKTTSLFKNVETLKN